MPDYRVESCVIEHPEEIKKDWNDLQPRAIYSYFQSWGWIETWLEQIAIELQPVAVKVWLNERLVGMGLFVSRDIKRRIVFRSKAMFLNEYPFDNKNMVIEYNGMLVAKGHENAVTVETVKYLLREYREHDEFCFSAIAKKPLIFCREKLFNEDVKCMIEGESAAWFVDLLSLPASVEGYLSRLSRNRRGQIRRSIRLYDRENSLQIDDAKNAEQAQLYFDRLKELHSKHWQSRGDQGAFSNPLWEIFHRSLIHRRFDNGEIQLLKVSSGDHEIGYIYNLVLHKHVYVIQTGFNYSEDKRLMPGYVAHTLAIAYNRKKGMLVYDLMFGDATYKRILCNEKRNIFWIVLQRKRLKFVIEEHAIRVARRLKDLSSGGP